ncbi:MAG: glycosyltransferase family 4 protein [Anaerolineae bacterium]|nr:glycosyltransferase family 4 protein [Anaerolineae bacterium]
MPSVAEINYLHRRYRVPRHKAFACPNWIDTERFQPMPEAEKQPRRVAFVGRFHAQKDPLVLLEALRGLPDVELLMIGGGPMKPQIEARVAELGLHATLLDRVSNEDLPRYLSSCALYALPTRYEGGSPKTLLEAMACGLPVICTDAFGANEAFEDGQHGVKIAVGDVAGLRAALQRLLDDPQTAQAMGQRARHHVLDQFSIERALQRELDVLAFAS